VCAAREFQNEQALRRAEVEPASYKFNRMGGQLHFTLVNDKCKLRIQKRDAAMDEEIDAGDDLNRFYPSAADKYFEPLRLRAEIEFFRTTSAPRRAIRERKSGFWAPWSNARASASCSRSGTSTPLTPFSMASGCPPCCGRKYRQASGHRFEHRIRDAFLVSIVTGLAR